MCSSPVQITLLPEIVHRLRSGEKPSEREQETPDIRILGASPYLRNCLFESTLQIETELARKGY